MDAKLVCITKVVRRDSKYILTVQTALGKKLQIETGGSAKQKIAAIKMAAYFELCGENYYPAAAAVINWHVTNSGINILDDISFLSLNE